MESRDVSIIKTKTPWEMVAETKWGRYVFNVEKKVIYLASSIVKIKDSVFEIGCEGGVWLSMLQNDGWKKLAGNEIMQDYLEICKKRIPTVKISLTYPDNTKIDEDDNSQEMLIVMEVPPVVNSTWLYFEANRILKPEGLLVVSLTNKNSIRAWILKLIKRFRKKQADYLQSSYSKSFSDFKKIIKENNMEILYGIGYCWFPFPRSSNSILIPIFIFLEKILFLNRILIFSPWICIIARKLK